MKGAPTANTEPRLYGECNYEAAWDQYEDERM
jgi:hypothetical protein